MCTCDQIKQQKKAISELQQTIERQVKRAADEHNTKKAKLLVEYETKVDEIKGFTKQCSDLESEIIRNSSSTSSMAERLEQKLASERELIKEREKEIRELEGRVRGREVEVEALRMKLLQLEQEKNRISLALDLTTKEFKTEEEKNFHLEFSVKQRESKI
eukprot:TRINITY_DN633_c0_g1_i3.p1 TRINITY_DN633_c0_g1~~TRINITY_DN633_c0_g1_i3.p1  ORF type:complete len:160 (+),score=51.41 TRINITY_DN633_c0_g1_i3:216-695(+)